MANAIRRIVRPEHEDVPADPEVDEDVEAEAEAEVA